MPNPIRREDAASDAPLFGWRGVPVAALLALILCWPTLVTGQVFTFTDTSAYLRGGAAIWDVLISIVRDIVTSTPDPDASAGGGVPTSLTVNARGQPVTGRSFTYSTAAYLAHRAGGPFAIAWAQGFVAVLMALAMIGREALARPAGLLAGFAILAVATALPWYTVFLIPDLMAAVVVMYGLILVGRLEALTGRQFAGATALAAIAASTHYGYMPLVAGVVAVALAWLLAAGRLRPLVAAVALVPILAAPLANLAASGAVLEEPSMTPRRLPILLARSIQDGPAQWYLQEACPEADLAFCAAFGENVPTHIGEFLWDEGGIGSLSPEQMNAIRAEEATILVRAFRHYPLAQSASLLRNWGLQIVRIGTRGIVPASGPDENWRFDKAPPDTLGPRLLRLADGPVAAASWAGAAILLALLLTGRLDRRQAGMVVLLAAGLLGNAAIFGGLSAPVERYQSRIAWLMPFLAILLLCEVAARRDRLPDTLRSPAAARRAPGPASSR